MEKDWVKIYSSPHLYQIQIIKGLLEGAGITAIEINRKDSTNLLTEWIDLYVNTADAFEARQFLQNKDLNPG